MANKFPSLFTGGKISGAGNAGQMPGSMNSTSLSAAALRMGAKMGLGGGDVSAAQKQQQQQDAMYAAAIRDIESGGKANAKSGSTAKVLPQAGGGGANRARLPRGGKARGTPTLAGAPVPGAKPAAVRTATVKSTTRQSTAKPTTKGRAKRGAVTLAKR
jgi:hypothetical protein